MTQQEQRAAELRGNGAIPLLGFGTWQLTGSACYDAVRVALDVGYRHLDTATMYDNEPEVGRAVRDSRIPREEVFITTKLPPGGAGEEQHVLSASLRALRTDYLDLWLVHQPPRGSELAGTWERLLAARDAGQARAVGVSNHSTDQLDTLAAATGEAPALNQIRWGPGLHRGDVVAEHRQRGVVLEGYSPFRSTDLRDPVLTGIAAAHGVSPAQVVLRWHLQHGIVVIPRSRTPERIVANHDVFGFNLDEGEMARIDDLGR